MLLELQHNNTKLQSVSRIISEFIASDITKITKSDLGLVRMMLMQLMNTMAMDFGIPSASPQQMDIIFALLDRNNNGYVSE